MVVKHNVITINNHKEIIQIEYDCLILVEINKHSGSVDYCLIVL